MARNLVDRSDRSRCVNPYSDFTEFVTGDLYTSLVADGGTSAAVGDTAAGIIVLTTGATDNNEVVVRTTKEVFKIVANKCIEGLFRFQYSEANTDDANVMCGFMDAMVADAMVNNGAGPKTSYSGAVVYKVDGGTKWVCQSSIGSTQTSTTSTTTAGGSSYCTVRICINPTNSTDADVTFEIDTAGGSNFTPLVDSNNIPIRHTVTYSSATEMMAGVYVKAGDTNSEVVNVDYIDPAQVR